MTISKKGETKSEETISNPIDDCTGGWLDF